MPLTLDSPININNTVDNIKINSFAVDLEKKEIHVGYTEKHGNTTLGEKVITIVEPDFTNTIQLASTEAGTDIYNPLKNSLYSHISDVTLNPGIVS